MYANIAAFILMPYGRTNRIGFVLLFDFLLQLLAEVIAKKMFLINLIVWLQNVGESFGFCSPFRKFKRIIFLEADNNDALSFLRNAKIQSVQDFVMDEISQVLQMVQNNFECSP